MKLLFESIVFSYSQIFFSNRKWLGIILFAGTMLNPVIGAAGLIGVALSNLFALYLKFDKEKVRSGFYGFNGLLTGAAFAFYFELTPFLVLVGFLFVFISFFLAAALENYLAAAFNLPGLSLPFVFTLYIFLIFSTNFEQIAYLYKEGFAIGFEQYLPDSISLLFRSISVIYLQPGVLPGIIFFIGILFFSRVMAVNIVIGYTLNYLLITYAFSSYSPELMLLSSFNAILTAIALGGSLIIVSRKSFLLVAIASVMVAIFTGFFYKLLMPYFLPVLVLPFNSIVLATLYSLKFRQEQSDLVLLYFPPGSPEENLYYHTNRVSRFEKFKQIFPELPFYGEWFISQGFFGGYTHKDDWSYAWDFIIKNESGKEFEDEGNYKADYYCYDTPVVSALEGDVVRVIDNITDNKIGENNLKYNWGNSVVLNHGHGLYSSMSHLKSGSIKVAEGDHIKRGQVIANCGNSGRSPYPHLHFQFQLTDKLGDKTYKFPFSSYMQKDGEKFILKSFEFPPENVTVANIELHKTLKKALNFRLGDEFEFECNLGEISFREKWEVKVDIMNNLFIESDSSCRAYIYMTDKIFYISSYIGSRSSALYFFYLLAIRVPLGYHEKLEWHDPIPARHATSSFIRYLSEPFLFLGEQIRSEIHLYFEERINSDDDFVIDGELSTRGKMLFSGFSEKGNGKMVISNEGEIKSLEFELGKKYFKCNLIIDEEKSE